MVGRFILNLKSANRNICEFFRVGKHVHPNYRQGRFFRRHSSNPSSLHHADYHFFFWYAVGGAFGYILADFPEFIKKFKTPVKAITPNGRRERFNFISDVSDIAAPAVVYVEIRDTSRFNHVTGQHVAVSAGSGFIVKNDGLIVTNAHVILQKMSKKNPLNIVVKLHDGRVLEAKVENVDKDTDLATLRIGAKNLPTIKLGRSVNIMPGEWVLALGSPLALSSSITCGVVSAHRRSAEVGLQKGKMVYIQIDASINNGNSGGPLMNLEGEAVGVNSMNIVPGISFATPIDEVQRFLKDSEDESKRMHVCKEMEDIRFLGIVMLTLTSDILEELIRNDLNISRRVKFGVLTQRVVPNSPAEKAGLMPGDVITHCNGKEVKIINDVFESLKEKDNKLVLTVYRGMNQLKITAYPEE